MRNATSSGIRSEIRHPRAGVVGIGHALLAAWLTLGSLVPPITHADTTVYRWQDSNGNPVVSDRPPPMGVPYSEIGIKTDTPLRRREALRSTPTVDPRAESLPVYEGVPVPALCTRALDHINKLETAPSIAVADGSGNVRMLSEDERATQLSSARQMADQHCIDA